MQAGRLRERITIQQQSVTRDAYGAEIITWPTLVTVWASIRPGSSGERFLTGAAQEQASITHTVRIRYRTGLTPKMRISWENRTLDIETIVDPDGKTAEMILLCSEVQT